MRVRSGMILTLAAAFTLAGCAAGGTTAAGGPAVSPIGKEYPPGIEPSNSQYTQQAVLALAQGDFQTALDQSREGIASDPENAQHFFLAGEAAAALGQYELADSMWIEAERIYPAYELEVEPAREGAWAEAFNVGVEAYNEGDMDTAIAAWQGATLIYQYRPGAAQNLGIVLMQEARYEEAADAFRRGLEAVESEPQTRLLEEEEIEERAEAGEFMLENLAQLLLYTDQFEEAESLLRQQLAEDPENVEIRANLASALGRLDRADEAAQIYAELLESPDLGTEQLFNVGVSLFNAGEHVRAAEAFGRVTEIVPNSRDAWYNQANALYAAEEWEMLVPIAERLVEVDPLNENTGLILARSYRELERNTDALAALERLQDLPIFVEDLQMQPTAESTRVSGRIVGNLAEQGSPLTLRFTFYGSTGQTLGSETVTVNAPAAEQSTDFQLEFGQSAVGYSYELQ